MVYLMGRVTEREADRATDIARSVSGVQKVVRVFEIISEAELIDLQPDTHRAGDRAASAERGQLRWLQPQVSRVIRLEVSQRCRRPGACTSA